MGKADLALPVLVKLSALTVCNSSTELWLSITRVSGTAGVEWFVDNVTLAAGCRNFVFVLPHPGTMRVQSIWQSLATRSGRRLMKHSLSRLTSERRSATQELLKVGNWITNGSGCTVCSLVEKWLNLLVYKYMKMLWLRQSRCYFSLHYPGRFLPCHLADWWACVTLLVPNYDS